MIILSIYTTIAGSFFRDFNNIPATCDNPTCDNDPILCPGRVMCEPQQDSTMIYLSQFCLIVFTIEYGIRVGICPLMPTRLADIYKPSWRIIEELESQAEGRPMNPEPSHGGLLQAIIYIFSYENLIDAAAIAPGWFVDSTASFSRVLRIVRLFRVFKALKFSSVLDLLVKTIVKSQQILIFLVTTTLVTMIFFGCLIFIFEGGVYTVVLDPSGAPMAVGQYMRPTPFMGPDLDNSEQSPFSVIYSCFYWAMITITTTGYGDLYPTSTEGRLVSCAAVLTGIMILAMPITIVGANFQAVHEMFLLIQKKERYLSPSNCSFCRLNAPVYVNGAEIAFIEEDMNFEKNNQDLVWTDNEGDGVEEAMKKHSSSLVAADRIAVIAELKRNGTELRRTIHELGDFKRELNEANMYNLRRISIFEAELRKTINEIEDMMNTLDAIGDDKVK